jgi:SdpC family antimicrobial peptide
MKKILTTAAATAALAIGATCLTALPASAATSHTPRSTITTPAEVEVSDLDVLGLFVGQGRLIADHPELAKYVPNNGDKISAADLRTMLAEYEAAYPAFHERITEQIRSGDPYKTLDALNAFRDATATIAADPTTITTGDGKCALLVAVAVAATLWLGVLVWVAVDGGNGLTNEQFAAEIAHSVDN